MKEVSKAIFGNFFITIRWIFSWPNILWHVLAVFLTYVIVISGFDWSYYNFFHDGLIYKIFFPATMLGFLVPLVLPLTLIIKGLKDTKAKIVGYAVTQAVIMGWLVSVLYKSLTGRAHPEVFAQLVTDVSRIFHFGFWRGGIFWGWPSSHTAVAFALSFVIITLFPQSKKIKLLALLYAFYVGFGVSISIHWFSDFVAGAILGTLVGITVGRSFKALIKN